MMHRKPVLFTSIIALGALALGAIHAPAHARSHETSMKPPAAASESARRHGRHHQSGWLAQHEDYSARIMRLLDRLDLTKEQRSQIHKILDETEDQRIRIRRKMHAAGDTLKGTVRKELTAVFSDKRKEQISAILDDEEARSESERRDRRGPGREAPAGEQTDKDRPGKEHRKGKDMGKAMRAYSQLRDRVFNEVKMSDADAEKMISAFGKVREQVRTHGEGVREEFSSLRETTRKRILEVLKPEQREKFEKAIKEMKDRRERGDTPPEN